jgi:hypothetical protein
MLVFLLTIAYSSVCFCGWKRYLKVTKSVWFINT